MASKYKKEKVQTISTTPQEMDAWEALRREPGLMGRLARRGKRMKPSYVGGRRSFNPNEDRANEPKADQGQFETRPDVIQKRSTAEGRGGDYFGGEATRRGTGGNNDQPAQPTGPTEAEIRAKIAAEEATKKKEKEKAEQ